MAENVNGTGRPDRNTYVKNRQQFPLEELRKYRGQWVAWSADGSRVVAHHEDPVEVVRQIDEAGISRDDVVLDLQPPDDVDTWL